MKKQMDSRLRGNDGLVGGGISGAQRFIANVGLRCANPTYKKLFE